MKRSVIGFTVAGALLVGGYATTSLAADDDKSSSTESSPKKWEMKMKGHFGGFFKGSSEDLLEKAKNLGISTSGKDAETLMKEIRDAQIKKEATLGADLILKTSSSKGTTFSIL